MKGFVQVARILVGILFIFSGLVKANDPLGLSYKMQEFFEICGITRFDSWTLTLSVLMNAFEIIAGVALLLGWWIRLFSWLLLLLILFFTFLTGYTYVTGEPTNCGCFGDCLLISSQVSFFKDLLLTILIAIIFWKQKYIRAVFKPAVGFFVMILVAAFSFGLQWYALRYLPPVDCLPFKKGNNITEKRKIPSGALPDSFAIRFIYQRDGKQVEFAPSDLPADLNTYTFVSRTDKLIRKGNAVPPIKGFSLVGEANEDSTEIILAQPYALLLICENFSVPSSEWKEEFTRIYKAAATKNIPAYVVTGDKGGARALFNDSPFAGLPILTCDMTAIRTAARTNPCLYLLKQGTVLEKEGWRRWEKIGNAIKPLPVQAAQPVAPVITDPIIIP